jgi:mono/diheme cytochrome c family protein
MPARKLSILILALLGSTNLVLAQPGETVDPGRQLFSTHCTLCHGPDGKGDGPGGAALDPPPRDLTRRPYKNGCGPGAIARTVRQGIPESGMPSFEGVLTDEEMQALSRYVRSLQGGCCHSGH